MIQHHSEQRAGAAWSQNEQITSNSNNVIIMDQLSTVSARLSITALKKLKAQVRLRVIIFSQVTVGWARFDQMWLWLRWCDCLPVSLFVSLTAWLTLYIIFVFVWKVCFHIDHSTQDSEPIPDFIQIQLEKVLFPFEIFLQLLFITYFFISFYCVQ